MATMDFSRATMDALFNEFRGGVDPFGPFIPPHFGAYNVAADDEVAELASLLYSVRSAGPRYRSVSLGCAPGEWALRAERAYRKRFPGGDFKSFNLEGDLDHFELTKKFLADNQANVADNAVFYKVIAERDGWAYFPIINSDLDWGAGVAALSDSADDLDSKISMSEMAKADRIGANGGKPLAFRTVPAVSLATLLDETGPVDFLHSDIQGAEADVFPAQMEAMDRSVRVCCIGTHGTALQTKLLVAFAEHGWTVECSYSCAVQGVGPDERCLKDGVFVWSNPRQAASLA